MATKYNDISRLANRVLSITYVKKNLATGKLSLQTTNLIVCLIGLSNPYSIMTSTITSQFGWRVRMVLESRMPVL